MDESGGSHGQTRDGFPEHFEGGFGQDDVDLGDFIDQFGRGVSHHTAHKSGGRTAAARGRDVQAIFDINLAQAIAGTEIRLQLPGNPPNEVTVRIPPGADDGSRLRVQGRGMAGVRNGPAGDLLIETHVRPHRYFRRNGLDLFLTPPITVDEAYHGANIEIPTPNGNSVMRVPPYSQSDNRLRLKGQDLTRGKSRGELCGDLKVNLPDKPDDGCSQEATRAATIYSRSLRESIRL